MCSLVAQVFSLGRVRISAVYCSTKLAKVISKLEVALFCCSRSHACASRLALKPRFCVCFRSPVQSV